MTPDKLNRYFSKSKYFLIPCFHLTVLFMVYELLVLGSFIPRVDIFHFKQWDARWYSSIAENGYQFSAIKLSNTAFFPMFPYIWKSLWKFTGAGVEGICLYNVIIFFAGLLVLKNSFKFSWSYFLLFASIPSCIFMYVPYSEATFFFFSSLILAGLKMNNRRMLIVGLFLASFTRPSAAFFIPAIIGMEVFAFDNFRTFVKNVLIYSVAPLIAILLIFLFQYKATGVWLVFFKDGWKREIQLPEFPLTTWGGFKILWLDGLALFFGVLATVILVILLFRKLKGVIALECSKAEVFSLIYVMMAMVTILLFGGRDVNGGTTLLSLNRFLIATPYFTIMLYFLSHHVKLDFRSSIIYFGVAVFVFFLLNLQGTDYSEYTQQDKFFYSVLMFGFMLLFLSISQRYQSRFVAMVYLINVFIQVIILCQFASGKWIG